MLLSSPALCMNVRICALCKPNSQNLHARLWLHVLNLLNTFLINLALACPILCSIAQYCMQSLGRLHYAAAGPPAGPAGTTYLEGRTAAVVYSHILSFCKGLHAWKRIL